MPSIITAGTTTGTALNLTGDTSGELQIKTNNGSTTALTLTTGGNLNIPTLGARITGDFTNATVANRVSFQTSTTNGGTSVFVIPNGTGTFSAWNMTAQSDPANASFISILSSADVSESRINSNRSGTGTYYPLTMYTGGSERMRIDTSGNVGIGTSSPSTYGKLAVNGSTYIAGAYCLQVTRAIGSQGAIIDSPADSTLAFYNWAGTERMRIDSSGQVGIGTASPTTRLTVRTPASSTNAIDVLGTDGTANNAGHFGMFADTTYLSSNWFYNGGQLKSAASLGSCTINLNTSATSASNYIGFGVGNAGAASPVERVVISQNGIGLGGANPTSGMGIAFPATQSASSDANTLDDYEEGTWTPNQGSGLSFSGGFSSSGIYTKIGNLVTVNFKVAGTNISCSSGGQITSNLPFAIPASPGNAMGSCMNSSNVNTGAYGFSTEIYAGTVALSAAGAIFVTITYPV